MIFTYKSNSEGGVATGIESYRLGSYKGWVVIGLGGYEVRLHGLIAKWSKAVGLLGHMGG